MFLSRQGVHMRNQEKWATREEAKAERLIVCHMGVHIHSSSSSMALASLAIPDIS